MNVLENMLVWKKKQGDSERMWIGEALEIPFPSLDVDSLMLGWSRLRSGQGSRGEDRAGRRSYTC